MPEEPNPPAGPPPEATTSGSIPATAARDMAGRTRQRRAGVEQLFEALEQQAPEQAKLLTNSLGMKLALIPAGKFWMGSAETEAIWRWNETPRHEVTLTEPFYLSIHLVTQEVYTRVMGTNPAHFREASGGGPQHPVERVSWEDAVEFCRRLSDDPAERRAGRVYRLPTEAEWEYACRAGTTTPFCYGTALAPFQANFDYNFPCGDVPRSRPHGKTTPVGALAANHFGLYDMHGNLWEWCADWYDGAYYRRQVWLNPSGPAQGRFRVVRGGCWRNHAATCRAAYRNALPPNNRDPYTGFRVVGAAGGAR